MAPVDSTLRARIYEQAALWRLTPEVGQEPLVRLACDALVGGEDSPGLVELAGRSTRDRDYDFEGTVAAALSDLDLALPGRDSAEAQSGATHAMSRMVADGRLTPRALARWAHFHIGHDGPAELQLLVELDDAYDIVDEVETDKNADDLDRDVLTEARRLLADGIP